jgi:hypothetical protein
MKRRAYGWNVVVPLGLLGAGLAAACGSSGAGDGSGTGPGADGGSFFDPDSPGGNFGDAPQGGDDINLRACATESQKATQLPLDLYVMFDRSGSMWEPVSPNVTKWDAVKSALGSFFGDPASAGIGVGLQFFPTFQAGVPATCSSSAQCPGATGPCTSNICNNVSGVPTFCSQESDCPNGGGPGPHCVQTGECTANRNALCTAINNPVACIFAGGGNCQALQYPSCANGDSCSVPDYQTPAVPIANLPGNAGPLNTALTNAHPQGNTPTSAGLEGAEIAARAFASANAGHTVVTVLATDGIPTECEPPNSTTAQIDAHISSIAAAALAGTPSIRTFVVGVFPQSQAAAVQPRLNAWASAGGTGSAFVITANSNTTQAFISALNQIRAGALPCDYKLPVPATGTPDYNKVNVQFIRGNGASTTFFYVKNQAGCDATTGGWYYDVDPASGATPTRVLLCPASCTLVKSDAGGRVDVVQGCQTITAPPK